MHLEYRKDIDGLRALSIIGVMGYHIDTNLFPGGFAGVDIFFVISGYLISKIIIQDISKDQFSLLDFWIKRSFRLLPALYLMIAFTLMIAFIIYRPSELVTLSKAGISVVLYYSNFYFWKSINYFDPNLHEHPLIHTWSLSVEEQFYFFVPLFFLIAAKLKLKDNIIFIIIITSVLISFIINIYGPLSKTVAQFYMLPTRFWELGLGVICCMLNVDRINKKLYIVLNTLRPISVISILIFFIFYKQIDFYPNIFTVIPVAATCILLISYRNDFLDKILSTKPLVTIGLISYSLYLWHNPIFAIYKQLNYKFEHGIILQNLILLMIIYIISFCSWKYVEQPFRYGWDKRKKLNYIISFCLILLTVFLTLIISSGLLNRYPESSRKIASLNISEAGKFVEAKFNSAMHSDFQEDLGKRKILIVGDSYAQDVVNIISFSRLNNHLNYVTLYVSSRCGNLYIPWDQLSMHISSVDKKYCPLNSGLFKNEKFNFLSSKADEIWFISRWQEWQVDLIRESLKLLKQKLPNSHFVVFGSKDLGAIDLRKLLDTPPDKRFMLTSSEPHINSVINNRLRKNIQDFADFYDTQSLICPEINGRCMLFDINGNLISYDGEHLTRYGALLLGSRF